MTIIKSLCKNEIYLKGEYSLIVCYMYTLRQEKIDCFHLYYSKSTINCDWRL